MRQAVLSLALGCLIVSFVVTPVALADSKVQTTETKDHDSSKLCAKATLDHPSGEPAFYMGQSAGRGRYNSCDSHGGNNVVDVYIAGYADRLSNGKWSNCHKYVRGWTGSNPGWGEWRTAKVQNTSWYSGTGSCRWGTYTLRARAFGKARMADGHILKKWAYSGGHGSI